MLKPINIIVFDSADLYDTLLEEYHGNTNKVETAFKSITDEKDESLISFYLPSPEEQQFYDEVTAEITNAIVKNSILNYGDTAYIMF